MRRYTVTPPKASPTDVPVARVMGSVQVIKFVEELSGLGFVFLSDAATYLQGCGYLVEETKPIQVPMKDTPARSYQHKASGWAFARDGLDAAFRDVVAFEVACGHPPTDGPPAVPDAHTALLRLRLVREERRETEDAMTFVESFARGDQPMPPDLLADVADGLADLIWVCLGTAVRFGIDLPAVWEKVREANMAKFGPGSHRREGGKLMKPPGWTPPDVAKVLADQRPLAETYGTD